jgi:uncharacterized protein (DUF983 family)
MPNTPQLNAMLHAKCPRCRRGDLFKTSMYGLKSQKMFDNCSKCRLRFEVEPWPYIFSILFFAFLLAPVNFRYSRVILLYWLSPKIKYISDYDHD